MADASAPLLAAENVTVGYGGRPVINGIGFTLRRGEILGLLGANGAGKSTLVKALTGQLSLIRGRVAIGGIDLAAEPERAKAAFGLAVEISELPLALTGRQYCELVASIRGCAADAWPEPDLIAMLSLAVGSTGRSPLIRSARA
jgi:ABC-2 type transport system ATP-binding protein